MKLHKNFTLFLVLTVSFFATSCAVLTDSQVKSIGRLAVVSDSVAVAPSVIFERLAHISMERGLFFCATISTPEVRVKELESLHKAKLDSDKLAKKANASVSVLESYLRSLRSLSNENRWKGAGTEIRGLGRNLDSMVVRYNDLEWSEEIEEGGVKRLSYGVAYIAEQIGKLNQAKLLRDYMTVGDTLVAFCTDQLVEVLKDERFDKLIENEREGLKQDYIAYLNHSKEADKTYLKLLQEIDDVDQIRSKCIRSLQSLKRAHNKILLELDKPQEAIVVFEELIELSNQAADLKKLFTSDED